MPMYEYQCPRGHVTEEVRTVDLRNAPLACMICGAWAEKRILHAPRVFSDYEGYESPASGKWIEGKRARREDLLRTGYRPWEEGDAKAVERYRAEKEAADEAFIDDCIMQTASELDMRTT